MTEKTKRLQITLRHAIPAEDLILSMLEKTPAGIARQHLLRNILQAGVLAMANPSASAGITHAPQTIAALPAVPAKTNPVHIPAPHPVPQEPETAETPRRRLSNLM